MLSKHCRRKERNRITFCGEKGKKGGRVWAKIAVKRGKGGGLASIEKGEDLIFIGNIRGSRERA